MKARKIIYSICFASVFLAQTVMAQSFEWAKAYGGTGFTNGISMVTDAIGNVYTTGFFSGTVDFHPDSSILYNLTSAAGSTYINKFDADGNFIWVKIFEGGYNVPESITLDNNDNILITGFFRSTVDFYPGSNIFNLTSAGNNDVYISKLDANGDFIAAIRLGSTNTEEPQSICVDSSNNIYISGIFEGTTDFDPGSGVYNLFSSGDRDIFILKLDDSGNFIWAKSVSGTSVKTSNSIKTDNAGNIYVVGYFLDSANFSFVSGVSTHTSLGGADIFILKLNTSGDYIWAKSFGGAFYDVANDVSFDSSGNIYTTGYFGDSVDFNPAAGVFNLTSAGYLDVFLSKLDTDGNFLGAKRIGGVGYDSGQNINIDTNDNVYITGTFNETVDFNPGVGVHNMTSNGYQDFFIAKLDAIGNFIGVSTIGGPLIDSVEDSYIDAFGNVYTTGSFEGTVDFNSDPGMDDLWIAQGSQDAFILKQNGTTTLSVDDNIFKKSLITYPNPTNGKSTINLGEFHKDIKLNIRTITGQLVTTKNYTSKSSIDFTIKGSAGLYFAEILADTKKAALKIIKQ